MFVPTRDLLFTILDQHADTVENDVKPPLVILGNEGSGKSAFLANWVYRRRDHKHKEEFLFQHFVGCSARSSQVLFLILTSCRYFCTNSNTFSHILICSWAIHFSESKKLWKTSSNSEKWKYQTQRNDFGDWSRTTLLNPNLSKLNQIAIAGGVLAVSLQLLRKNIHQRELWSLSMAWTTWKGKTLREELCTGYPPNCPLVCVSSSRRPSLRRKGWFLLQHLKIRISTALSWSWPDVGVQLCPWKLWVWIPDTISSTSSSAHSQALWS